MWHWWIPSFPIHFNHLRPATYSKSICTCTEQIQYKNLRKSGNLFGVSGTLHFWDIAKKKMLMVFITIEMCLLVGNIPFGEAVAAAKTWCFSCVFRLPIQQPHNSDFDSDGFCTLATCNGEVHRYPAQSPRKREGVESSASGSTNWHYGTMDATDRAVAIPAGIDRHPPYWRAPCRSSKR